LPHSQVFAPISFGLAISHEFSHEVTAKRRTAILKANVFSFNLCKELSSFQLHFGKWISLLIS